MVSIFCQGQAFFVFVFLIPLLQRGKEGLFIFLETIKRVLKKKNKSIKNYLQTLNFMIK